jgi:hypothetical protein
VIGRSHILAWKLCPCRQCRGQRNEEKRLMVRRAKRAEKKLWTSEQDLPLRGTHEGM